jgi:hypothetical protein
MNEIEKFMQGVQSLSMRDKVTIMESEIKKVECLNGLKLTHRFSDGVYARELFIPKDTIIVGKIHKYENLNFLLQGEVSVLIDDEIKRIKAPHTVVSPAGTKRIAYTHSDTIWTTVLRTDETNVDKIEDYFTAQSEQEFIAFCKQVEQFKLPLIEAAKC